ncbi:MAG TPA: universal stress protein [Puia sp.]|nr:universal stress protein [Puia sp.]
MKSLVVPVDGSENSINAAHYAADMALAIDADLHLLHVVRIQSIPGEAPVGYIFDDMHKSGKALLYTLSDDLRERTHNQVSIATLLEVGSPESKILEVCRRLQPFAVIMGAPEGSFTRALSGSPVLDASRHLPYPVLVVPSGAAFRRIRNIVLAGDVKDIAGEMPITTAFLKELRAFFDSRFDILHIVSDNERKEGLKALGLYHWKQALGDVDAALHFVKSPSLLEGVQQYLFEHQGDWLMLFPGKHGLLSFHRSQSKPLILHCTVPVMSICEAARPGLGAPAAEIIEPDQAGR